MTDYQPNSHRFKEQQTPSTDEPRVVQKVATGKVQAKKRSEMRKFRDIFISEDAKNVKSYVFLDVLVPAIKKAISDIVTDGIDMILYGESRHRKGSSGGSKISYRKFYDERDSHDRPYAKSNPERSRFDSDEIIFESRGEAEAALEEMGHVIERYGFVTVADMYDMAQLSQPYTSNRYGWMNLGSAEIIRLRGGEGYVIRLPKAAPIER